MAAYLIADVDVTDAAAFEEYRREVPETERRYRGRYLGRGGATKVLEGDWEPHRLVIIEFPDMASLMALVQLAWSTPRSRHFVKNARGQGSLPLRVSCRSDDQLETSAFRLRHRCAPPICTGSTYA